MIEETEQYLSQTAECHETYSDETREIELLGAAPDDANQLSEFKCCFPDFPDYMISYWSPSRLPRQYVIFTKKVQRLRTDESLHPTLQYM